MSLAALIAVLAPTALLCYQWGYSHGKKDGYQKRSADEETWWLRAEREVELEREKIWRQE